MIEEKKAQIQISESIFVVIIILFLIILGIVFSSNAEEDVAQKKAQDYLDLSAISLSQYAASLSELQCSTLEVRDLSCFDKDKLDAFVNLTKNHPLLVSEYYFSQLGNSNVTVHQVYPENKTWNVYYNGFLDNVTYEQKPVLLPISLYDGVTKKYGFGVVYITKFQKVNV